MHLLIAFASDTDPGCVAALAGLRLPRLERLLAELQPADRQTGRMDDLSPPHERAIARLRGWSVQDGLLPWAAHDAQGMGVYDPSGGWGWITPMHCTVGQSRVSLQPAGQLALAEADARALLASMAPFFAEDGITLHYAAPERWLARAADFAALPTASLDRVAGRDMGDWMPASPLLHRLQNEMQMLLYTHPVNDTRAQAGQLPVNAFWLSGTGSLAPGAAVQPPADLVVEERLRDPALAGDWGGWREVWQHIDAEYGERLLQALRQGQPDLRLTLCGARHAATWQPRAPGWATWLGKLGMRRRRIDLQPVLSDL